MPSSLPPPALKRRVLLQAGVASAAVLPVFPRVARAQAAAPASTAPAAASLGTGTGAGAPLAWQNWSGIAQAQPRSLFTPTTVSELQGFLRQHREPVRCVGSGHSFTPLVPTPGHIVALDRLSGVAALDMGQRRATVLAGTRLGVLSRALDAKDLALRNLPDIDAQTLAGAISTATHGTGAQLPALHADVQALQLVLADGSLLECSAQRNADLLAAARVSLGALGVLVQAQVALVPRFQLRRKVWLQPVQALLEQAPELAARHRHFEFYYLPFTGYAAAITHDETDSQEVHRPPSADEDMLRDLRRLRDWAGRWPELRRWVAGKLIDPDMTESAQDRSWRLLSTQRPTKFNESECHVPREMGLACVREVIATLERRNDVFFPLEFRFVKADDAWLSPFYQRDSCSIAVHAAVGEPYDYLVQEIGPVFRKYQGRPHWGKLHVHNGADLAALYPRWKDFLALRAQLDPQGRFLNEHLRRVFGVAA
ncbi:MAG: D-arabinono-1,4-lactone oxidase [Rhodoferax sp.]